MSQQEPQATVQFPRLNFPASGGKPVLWVFLTLASISIVILLGWKGPHLLWLLLNPWDLSGVPASQLPISPSPAGAERFQVGSLSILLPPEWKNDVRTVTVFGGGLLFKDGQRELLVGLPQSYEKVFAVHRQLDAGLAKFSPMRLRAVAYKTGKEDFRIWMSWKELDDFCQMLAYKRLACSTATERIEELYRDDIEGLLMISKGRATFEWISADGHATGTLLFSEPSQHIDCGWVRAICSSLQFSGKTYPERPSQEMLDHILKETKR